MLTHIKKMIVEEINKKKLYKNHLIVSYIFTKKNIAQPCQMCITNRKKTHNDV